MASSNRHWPSMFKSKPCNTDHQQWQHDINPSHISTTCHRNPNYSPGYEDRTPEPKPRWNPRPEQIRILEAIFNSGMVNPPRDEIRKIRAQLQQYGQVGDANVFYWFQNRKSRSKHKKHKLSTNITSSSSSSSDKSSSNEKAMSNVTTVIACLNSPTASVNQRQTFLQASNEFLTEPFLQFPRQQNDVVLGSDSSDLTQGFCFNEHQSVDNCSTGVLLSEAMLMSYGSCKRVEDEKMKFQQQLSCAVTTAPSIVYSSVCDNSPTTHILQGACLGDPKSTVFINNVYYEVGSGPFNVREAFGDDAVLIQSNGQQVLTNEWGVTLDPLQHGAFYYLIRAFTPSPEDI